jgi:hypothetical protein
VLTPTELLLVELMDSIKKITPKRGAIELYSSQYFVACTIGGIIGTYIASIPPSYNVIDFYR